MYIKRYTVAAFILMALVGSYFYISFPNEKLAITVVGINIPSLSIAVWIVLAMFVLYLATVGHMLYYSVIGSFKLRKFRKDSETFVDSVRDALLGRIERHHSYKTERYALFAKVLDASALTMLKDIGSTGDEKLDQTIELLNKIKNGEHVDLKKYYLSSKNPLVQQNDLNAYNAGDISEEQILNNADKYSEELVSLVFTNYAKTAPLNLIDKYKSFLTKTVLFSIVARVNAEENILDISTEHLISLFSEVELKEEGFINLSATLSNNMLPDERIKLFQKLSETCDTAMPAYLYTLFDLEMIAPAEEILENSQPDEFTSFKAYKALKDCHQHFSIELFIPHKIYS
ncbi:MAG: hypothetical protein WBF77_05635 [Sulfurimonadaceae bacterium]